MQATRFTDLVGCEVPIQLAPMGSVSTPDLAAAVAGAGGHAMLAITGMPRGAVEQLVGAIDARGITPHCGLNLLVPLMDGDRPLLDREVVDFAASRVPLVDFYLGPPDRELVDIVHARGALAGWQVTSRDEAVAAEAAGCDLVIAHGVEAGGRNPGGIGLLPLLAEVLDAVRVPVIAAGGIANGRGIAAALAMGADGVRLGTRFLAAEESTAHPQWIEALIAARAEDAVYSEAFHLMFPPDRLGARVLREAAAAALAFDGDTVAEVEMGGETMAIPPRAPHPPTRLMTGDIAAMAMYAGQSAGMVRQVQPAAEIMRDLIDEATASLRTAAALLDDRPTPGAAMA